MLSATVLNQLKSFHTSLREESFDFTANPLLIENEDSDIVTLQPFMDYINDPTLLVALMT